MDPIERKAKEIIKKTGLLSTPTKVVAIARLYGFDVYNLDNIDDTDILAMTGVDKRYPSGKIIALNSKKSKNEKRYAIAHELGHYILAGSPKNGYAHINSLLKYNEKERDALIFASALLMPKDDVKRVIKKSLYLSKVTYIAKVFGVPEEVAEVRLKRLGLA